jgi:sugar lactone lactonase YvrE
VERIFAVVVSVLAAVTVTAFGVAPVGAAPGPVVGGVKTVRAYNAAPDSLELPEGVAVDKRGAVYVTFPFLGELRRVDRNGTEHLVATLPTGGGFGPLGLTPDAPGNLYVGVVTTSAATQGVYRVTPEGMSARLPGTEAIAFANDVTFGDRGTLYVADSVGKVWRIPKGGSAELFLESPLLVGNGSLGLGFPVGANGITYRHGTLYVTVTEQSSIVAIPVRPDGSAGEPSMLVQDPALFGADGVELDVHGNLFVSVIAQSTLVHVASDTLAITTLLDGSDGLDFPSTAAFGTGGGERRTLYAVNFSVGPFFGGNRTAGPRLLAIKTNATGLPQP